MLKSKELKYIVWDSIFQYTKSPQAKEDCLDVFNYTQKEKAQIFDALDRISSQVQVIRNKYRNPDSESPLVPEAQIEG